MTNITITINCDSNTIKRTKKYHKPVLEQTLTVPLTPQERKWVNREASHMSLEQRRYVGKGEFIQRLVRQAMIRSMDDEPEVRNF